MSQIIVAQDNNGIVLAAENRAVQLDAEGKEIPYRVNRLLPIATHVALLTSGAAEGIGMGSALKLFIQEEGLKDIQDIYQKSLAFLSTEYERFMMKICELAPIDPLHQVSFILAGKTEKDLDMPFRLYLLWTKKKLPRLDGDEISFAFSIPRRVGLEYQLNKLCKAKESLENILGKVKIGMDHLKGLGEISFPVTYATISKDGYQVISP